MELEGSACPIVAETASEQAGRQNAASTGKTRGAKDAWRGAAQITRGGKRGSI